MPVMSSLPMMTASAWCAMPRRPRLQRPPPSACRWKRKSANAWPLVNWAWISTSSARSSPNSGSNTSESCRPAPEPAAATRTPVLIRRRSLVEVEEVLLLGLFHALLEVLFPHLRPRPAVHVGHFVLDHLARRDGRGMPFHRHEAGNALDVLDRVALTQTVQPLIVADDAQGFHERLGVIEDGLVVQR